jgi:oxalate---CoA ligase
MAGELNSAGLVPALCGAWANILLYPEAGPDSDFLECGGDSLTAMRLATHVSRLTGRDVRVDWIFECGTPARLAAFLEESR